MPEEITSSATAVVVDDEDDIRDLVAEILRTAGFHVVTADNGLDGVAAVEEHRPLLVTLDATMPGIDGFETARRIRAVSDTHIIMLTALADEASVARGFEAGAGDYLTKPFRPRELRARVSALVTRH